MIGAVNHMHFDPGRKQLLIGSDAGVIAALSRTGGLRACSRRRRARPLASLARAVWRQALRPFVTTDALLFDGCGCPDPSKTTAYLLEAAVKAYSTSLDST